MVTRRLGVEAALVEGRVQRGDLSVEGGRVAAVGLAPGVRGGGIAVPGFVDWQVNGFGGVAFRDADHAGLASAAGALARAGIVWAAPTLYDTTIPGYCEALGEITEFRRRHPDAGLLGAHLEGPHLSPQWNGAHDPANLTRCDPAEVAALADAGDIVMVTIAPELHRALELIGQWRSMGVVVAVGHSDADAACCARAAEAGASVLTHCWNAHRRFTHRDPGPAGWALADEAVTLGLIADGVHVAPEALRITFAAAPGRVAVTTDAVAAAGTVDPGATPRLGDGTLAGSVATPSSMLGVLSGAGVPFAEAVESLSVPQSRVLGLPGNRLRPGDRADVVVLDEGHGVLGCWRAGKRVT